MKLVTTCMVCSGVIKYHKGFSEWRHVETDSDEITMCRHCLTNVAVTATECPKCGTALPPKMMLFTHKASEHVQTKLDATPEEWEAIETLITSEIDRLKLFRKLDCAEELKQTAESEWHKGRLAGRIEGETLGVYYLEQLLSRLVRK